MIFKKLSLSVFVWMSGFLVSVYSIELDQADPDKDSNLSAAYCSAVVEDYRNEINSAEMIAMNAFSEGGDNLSCGTTKFEISETARVTVRRNSPPGASLLLGEPWEVAYFDAKKEGHKKACEMAKDAAREVAAEMTCPSVCSKKVITWGRCSPGPFSEDGVFPKKADKPWKRVGKRDIYFGETWEVSLSVTRTQEFSLTCREPSWWRDLFGCAGSSSNDGDIISSETTL